MSFQQSQQKNLEIRYHIIGDDEVGKKSLCSRFEKLNSSETFKGKKIKIEVPPDLLDKLNKLEEYKQYESKVVEEIYKTKLKEKSAVNFVKIFTISNVSIEKRFFIIPRAVPVTYIDSKAIVEELSDIEREYKLKFDKVKQEIKLILSSSNFNYFKNNYCYTKHVFLFVYDLSNPESLEKAVVYFEELNKTFKFTNNEDYSVVFFGNKLDIRIPKKINKTLKDEDSEKDFDSIINNLMKKYGKEKIHHYDVSTKMFFSFENLQERMFEEVFIDYDPLFKEDYFKEKLLNILHLRKTFAKASKQNIMILNNNPSPNQYNADIYYLNDKDEVKKAYVSKQRYYFKPFINKIGPVFKSTKSLAKSEYKDKAPKTKKEEEEAIKHRMELLNEINAQKLGFSLGVKSGSLNLMLNRKSLKQEKAKCFESLTSLNNITRQYSNQREMKVHPKIRKGYKARSRKSFEKNRRNILLERSLKNQEYMESLNEKWEEINNLKLNNSMEKQKFIVENKEKRIELKNIVSNNKKEIDEKLKNIKPNETEIKSSIELNKGFSIVGKPKEVKIKTGFNHALYSIKSDFELIGENIKDDLTFCKASRFGKEMRYYDSKKKKFVTSEDDNNMEKAKKINLMEEMSQLRLHKKQEYLEEQQNMRENRRNNLRASLTEQQEIFSKNHKHPSVWSYEPDYYPWGKSSPSYSISGRIGKGFLDVKASDNTFEGSAKLIASSLSNGIVPLPNFDSVYSSPPKFSFSKSKDRFNLEKAKDRTGPGSFFKQEVVTINRNKEKVL